MTDRPMQLALRDLRRDFQRPALWAVLVGVGLVLAMAGAFGTAGVLRPVPLALYWVSVAILTYAVGAVTVGTVGRALHTAPRALRLAAKGCAAGVAVCAVVTSVNTALFGADWATGAGLLRFAASTVATTVIITVILDIVYDQRGAGTTDPALFARLPVAKRGPLLSLSAVDHYVEVTTTRGTALILLRLADAIAETHPIAGLRIHRSHWVARDQIADVSGGAGKATVTLSDGRTLPVSRSNLPALKEHGLLPA
ncbi:MAG: LytTR family DNA-binding domain-containing protein [Pseudomonadota bacterium]